MITAPLPPDETQRLRLLRSLDILDTPADPTLDALVHTTARVLGSPIALVSLVDADRQWFKAAFGLQVRQTPRDVAFCAHTILGHEALVVPDALRDPRFADNPLVTGAPHVRFYAAVPLVVGPCTVGTLCVIDHRPRAFSRDDQATLADLARVVEHWLESRQTHQRLLESEQQFRLMAEQTPGIVYRAALDADSSTLYVSPRIRELGYTPEEWMVRPDAWAQAVHPDDLARVLAELAASLVQGDAVHLQYRIRDVHGRWRHYRDIARRVRPPGSDADVLQGVMIDVTDRVEGAGADPLDARRRDRREAQLRRLSAAVQQASEAICITDLEGRIEYVNRAACDSSGYPAAELIGQHTRMLKSGHTPIESYRDLWAELHAGRTWRGFLFNRRKNGSEYVEFATITPVRDAEGRVTGYLAVKEDVTEKRRMSDELEQYRHRLDELVAQRTAELQRAREAAESASQAKSAFLAAMSHEIRTPMNGVIGILDVLQQSSLTPYQKELTDTIGESATSLLRVIDDILDFSKIEAGRLDLECAPFDLDHLVESVCDALQPLAAARGVDLRGFVDPALPPRRLGDALRLRQILTNLVGNAIKFSSGLGRPGRVSLRARAGADGAVLLDVRDNGIGIADEVLSRLFQPFVQGDPTTTRLHGGTGLGLVISQRLAAAMGGAVTCESRVGEGSVFGVRLALALDGSAAAEPAVRHDLAGLCCHLLLDDPERVHDWGLYLRAAGAAVRIWSALPDAEVLADASPGTPVLVTTARWLGLMPAVRVAVVQVQPGQRRSARWDLPDRVLLDLGGLHRQTLLGAVALAARRTPMGTGPDPAAASAPRLTEDLEIAGGHGRVVLVAEDNEVNRKVIAHQIHLLGFACEVVRDGLDALQCLRAAPDRYGLLLTDLHMPRLDGYDLAARIRAAHDGRRRLPIVALTANALHGEEERCLAAGMDGHLSKPVRLVRLRAELARWLPGTEDSPVPGRGATPRDARPDGEAALRAWDDDALSRLVGPDAGLLAELRRQHGDGVSQALAEIDRAAGHADWGAVAGIAHRMKSSSGAVGALALARLFEALEQAAGASDEVRMRALAGELHAVADELGQRLGRTEAGRGDPPSIPRVLVVDDEPFQRRVIERQLQAMDAPAVETFAHGEDLLRRLREIDTQPVLLLLDLNMPGMDGVELIRHLAQGGFAGTLVPISGADRRVLETVQRLAQAWRLRTVGHLHKPVATEALRDLLARWRGSELGQDRLPVRLYAASEVRAAIDGGALRMHYQPQVALADGALVGLEALVRWQHPEDGLVGPDAFVPVAEAHGLIDALTMAVLDRVLAQSRRWRDAGRPVRVSVNVSMDNLSRLDFPDQVLALLARHGVPPQDLVLEVTETRLMKDLRAPLDILARLRLRGVTLSIDDFGTGHSSLAQLRDLPFEELKIDRGFVHGGRSHATVRAILTGSVEMAHQLRMAVVAEGVEDQADWDLVHEVGCHAAQGWHIAPPMDAEALERWHATWQADRARTARGEGRDTP